MTKPAVTLTADTLTIRLDYLLDNVSTEDRIEIIRRLGLDEVLIKDIVDQLATGYTDDVSSVGSHFLDQMRLALAPMMSDVAAEAVRGFAQERDSAKAEAARHSAWAYKLYHAWPDEHWRVRPQLPDFVHTFPMDHDAALAVVGAAPTNDDR